MEGNSIFKNIKSYKKRYYINFLIRSIILSFSFLISTFLFYNLLEYIGNFNSVIRGIFFYSYLLLIAFAFFKWIILPVLRIYIDKFQISDEAAAKNIGGFFSSINDKLVNIIQLYNKHPEKHDLVKASIIQKSQDIQDVKFDKAISFSEIKNFYTIWQSHLLL